MKFAASLTLLMHLMSSSRGELSPMDAKYAINLSKYGQEARTVLRSRAEQVFADYRVELNIIIIDVVIQGDAAHDYGWHEWIFTPKAGGPVVRRRDRYFELWTREPDGFWRISFFLNNADVRERIGSSVSRWFMTEEPAIA